MEDLKKLPVWVLWRKGKKGKVPLPAAADKTVTGTSEAYRDTWVTYDEALKAVRDKGTDGIGAVIPEVYVFVDIDNITEDRKAFSQLLLSRFESYAERSPSGNGIHILGLCDISMLPVEKKGNKRKVSGEYYQKNSQLGLELYIGGLTNRFATFTGDVIGDNTVIRDCTNAVLITLNREMRRKKIRPADNEDETFDIICDLKKQINGEKFYKLFNKGDYSDYGSHSEADLALCGIIAFRTGPDPALIDAVFRQSALYRDKWERQDYRDLTIARAISCCRGNFHKSVMTHPSFVVFDKKGRARVDAILLAQYVRSHLTYILVRDNGRQAVRAYVYENGVYSYFAKDMLIGVVKQYIADYDEMLVDLNVVSKAIDHIMTDRNYVSEKSLNSEENVINFRNGLLYVYEDRLELKPHNPSVLSTIQIPCNWSVVEKPTPVFNKYLMFLISSNPEYSQVTMEAVGVIISNIKCYRMKKALFMVGPGDSGKSVIKSLAEYLVGADNFIGVDLDSIEARFGTGAVYGKRLVGSADMSFVRVKELKTFKRLTGGDSVFAEFKGEQAFEYQFTGFLWFCMNKLPAFGGDDGKWVYDRIMVVECPNSVPKEEQDKFLLDKLCAESEGIVYKAVKALQQVIKNGYKFSEGECIKAAREDYRGNNSTVISFFNECMCHWPDGVIKGDVTTQYIYKAYREWCLDNNHGYSKTAREFREDLASYLNCKHKDLVIRRNNGNYYKDYTLVAECQQSDFDNFLE